jgi:hypothetical protein
MLQYESEFFITMTTYNIWVSSGEDSFARTYFNELGAVQLTQEQVEKYFTFTEDGEIEFDSDLLAEATEKEYDDPERDMPSWDTITDGCICWGPDVDDQNIGVSLVDEEETPIWVKPISTLTYYTKEDIENSVHYQEDSGNAIACYIPEMEGKDGVWIVYNSYERGGYIGEFEIPDDQEFDPSKLIVHLTEVAECWTVVSSIEYDGEDVYCDGDTIGKGIDWYVYHNDNLYSFK